MITGARPLSLPLALDQDPLGVDDVENNNSLAIAEATVRRGGINRKLSATQSKQATGDVKVLLKQTQRYLGPWLRDAMDPVDKRSEMGTGEIR